MYAVNLAVSNFVCLMLASFICIWGLGICHPLHSILHLPVWHRILPGNQSDKQSTCCSCTPLCTEAWCHGLHLVFWFYSCASDSYNMHYFLYVHSLFIVITKIPELLEELLYYRHRYFSKTSINGANGCSLHVSSGMATNIILAQFFPVLLHLFSTYLVLSTISEPSQEQNLPHYHYKMNS